MEPFPLLFFSSLQGLDLVQSGPRVPRTSARPEPPPREENGHRDDAKLPRTRRSAGADAGSRRSSSVQSRRRSQHARANVGPAGVTVTAATANPATFPPDVLVRTRIDSGNRNLPAASADHEFEPPQVTPGGIISVLPPPSQTQKYWAKSQYDDNNRNPPPSSSLAVVGKCVRESHVTRSGWPLPHRGVIKHWV
ncbi:uncharacterized protein PG986_013029 [Apiospora aurea]|uniref:Uncharacterized protein n=1 Tax=Apiospora aurea TaxID=335848 RepID=A0ABR1Q1M6_9PEZI